MKFRTAAMLVVGLALVIPAHSHAAPPDAALAPEVAAVSGESDALLVTGQVDRLRSANGGGGGSIDWIHTGSQGASLSGGLASYALADSRWMYGRVAGAARIDERLLLEGDASLGAGRAASQSFDYRLLRAGVGYRIHPVTWVRAEDKFIDIGDSRGHLLRIGALLIPAKDLWIDIGYARSTGGNLHSELRSIRADWSVAGSRLFGGYTLGRSVPDLFGVDVGGGTADQRLRECFLGIAIPIARMELTAVLDTVDVNASRRRTVLLGLRIPLQRSAGAS